MTSVSPSLGSAHPSSTPVPEILPAQQATDLRIEVVARDPLARAFALPCTLTLEVQVMRFTVGDLMTLTPGTILETHTQQNEDLPLQVNGQLVGLVEIEVVGEHLAVRLTGIA